MRVDKIKNVQKVMKEVIKNPLATQREIAEKSWLSLWAVNGNLKEIEQIWTSSDLIIDFVKSDMEVQEKIQEELMRRLTTAPQDIRDPDLKWYAEFALKRSQLLQGRPTEKTEVVIEI